MLLNSFEILEISKNLLKLPNVFKYKTNSALLYPWNNINSISRYYNILKYVNVINMKKWNKSIHNAN